MKRTTLTLLILAMLVVLLFGATIFVGSVKIPFADVCAILNGSFSGNPAWSVIVTMSRLPASLAAMLTGAALAVAGLQLQTTFSNPLAGPSILGVSTGASLGVGIVMLACGGLLGSVGGAMASIGGAFLGAATVILLLLLFSRTVTSSAMLLIVGIILGYLSSSAISLLSFFSTQEGVHSYVIWGLGSFNGMTVERAIVFVAVTLPALLLSWLFVKPLDAMMLGEEQARALGVDVRRTRGALLVLAGVLTAVPTAFCGPIAFLGLIVPHMARLLLRTSVHSSLLPATMLCGAATGLFCQLVSVLPASGVIPVNAITPVIGAPLILYIIVNRNKIFYLR